QVHFREPGLTHKGDLATESRAAVAGGITSYMEMPNTHPPTTTEARLESKFQAAAGRSHANYSFYLGATNDNLQEIKTLDPLKSCGIKVFMGSSTGNLLVDDIDALKGIFSQAPAIVATHCEDDTLISTNARRCREKYGEDVPMSEHPRIRSEEACYRSTRQAVELAQEHGTRLHILHLTTARELSLLSNRPPDEKKITAEVCVHHLFFDDTAYASKGTRIKCNPAIKSPADRQALLEAVEDGRIDVVATDHAPHTLEEKQQTYFRAPAGLPLVEHALACLLEHYHDGRWPLPLIAEKTAHAPARLFQLKDRGYIREGYWADLTLVDTCRPYRVDEQPVFARCGWTPFDGLTFRSSIDTTIVSGQLAYRNGRIGSPPAGMRLAFDR
ncbi:MAG: dihydroorotase, partial [Deltaproteobacteria bacterium SG8_13]